VIMKDIRFRLHLNILFGICIAVVFAGIAIFLVYSFLLFPGEVISNVSLQIFLPIIILIALFVIMMLIFMKKIYKPIKSLEQAVKVVSSAENIMDFELEIDEGDELYEMAESINKMIYLLKEFANKEYTASLLVKQAELNALQTQINPHFLYNTLDSIRGLALAEQQDKIATMTKALSVLFRYSISKTEDMSSLRDEIVNVENYITIQQFRFPEKFVFIKEIDNEGDSDILDFLLPKLTIQPIIENAVFHGLETKLDTGSIILRAYTTEKRLVISIEDDGVGIDSATLERINDRLTGVPEGADVNEDDSKKSSIALSNVNDRIKLFFGDEYGVSVSSTLNMGTTVEISLPLEKKSTESDRIS